MDSKRIILFFVFSLAVFDIFLWAAVFNGGGGDKLQIYFLNVGQGDSELLVLPGVKPAKILIDSGPNGPAVKELDKILPFFSRRVDIAAATHLDSDHTGGFSYILKRFKAGIFAYNGSDADSTVWKNLKGKMEEEEIPKLVLKRGDKIKYGESEVDILHPPEGFSFGNTNEAALVMLLKNREVKAIFMGDVGKETEKMIVNYYNLSEVDILKVAHHGSKYSSSEEFLNVIKPRVSVIEVGKNSYGHPTVETLKRLALVKSLVFRTDKNGTIKAELIYSENGKGKFIFSSI
ncbi:MAG: hypothetical protein A2390_03000 [Candidatus Liptonbacteria bacterium RIFOXYB1_FULL_36_10]|uniref:Metallo-beta-lactamase domain-containing protein n=1 Tax=Candidatus Liptonbacteria bacterium RIFOXYB1_FULL_36_10 TaxID=1798654 RepID=A0A1G2CPI9_9BACT|nr:MAG: hypothetical protein A2390_03000 [Candidatus Liptonbacteria bacterium RIFOXYB1_FULL_36_10]